MNEKTLDRLSRVLLGIAAFGHAAGACVYALVQPRGFAVLSAAFFEHGLLGPLVFVLALVLGYAVAKRREGLAAGAASAFSGFWIVVAGYGFFAGTTFFARLLALPIAASLFLFLLAYRTRRQSLVLGLPLGAGALVGAAFWASAIAPPATTLPAGRAPKTGPIPEAAPALDDERLSARVEGTSIFIDAGASHAEIVPSFDYTSVAERCGLSVLEFRSAALPPFRAGREGNKLFFAAENADFQTYGEISIERGRAARIEVSTTVRRELCAHLGSAVAVRIEGGRNATLYGVPWPAGGAWEPFHFVAFRGDELGFFRASRDEKGPFTRLEKLEDAPIDAGGLRVHVPSWAAQASRAPSPTAGWGISQGAIEHVGDWFFWAVAATSLGRGWHTVRTAPGTYEMTILVRKL